jgi:carbamoyltransferase
MGHDTSAALIQDGRVVFAAEEERFSRNKHDTEFPKRSIRAALHHGGLDFKDLDAVAFGCERSPAYGVHEIKSLITGKSAFNATNIVLPFLATIWALWQQDGKSPLQKEFGSLGKIPIYHVNHHESHAWSAYALSGFDESLVLVIDGHGERQSTTMYHARSESLRLIKEIHNPNSLGNFYAAFTDYLGFQALSDEWKVMGLAAYGEPNQDLRKAIRSTPNGYWVNGHLYSPKLQLPVSNDATLMEKLYGPKRNPEKITKTDQDLAASVQLALEQAITNLVQEGIRLTGCKNLSFAGGVAMNSKANGRLFGSGLVDRLFVQPAATDDGTAVGAAIGAHTRIGAPLPRYRLDEVYWGPQYSEDEILGALKRVKAPATFVSNVEEVIAHELAQGKIIGWFQGRLEFGPRALGNRSILADPRRVETKDLVNNSIKFRENWRPFAPACLVEEAGNYFQGCTEAPFMIVTYEVKPDKRSIIPAVTHVDNSARVQTVSQATNPRFHALIKEFGRRTGVPVIMNTSFNLKGEPIVCSPEDALKTFYSSGLDFLVLGNYVVAKDPAWRLPKAV